jgi:hypothetical protein
MVDIKPTVVLPGQGRRQRLARIQKLREVPGVRVVPADGDGFTADDMRRLLKHPRAGGFRAEGSIEWPNDIYTFRRLREGSIKLEEEKPAEPPPVDPVTQDSV